MFDVDFFLYIYIQLHVFSWLISEENSKVPNGLQFFSQYIYIKRLKGFTIQSSVLMQNCLKWTYRVDFTNNRSERQSIREHNKRV